MKRTIITIEEAVGLPLSHDLTKGAQFKRGHIVTRDDLPVLRGMGREHLSILELEEGEVHEDVAATRIADKLKSASFETSKPSEGRCNLIALRDGILAFDEKTVHEINSDDEWVFSTLANHSVVKKGDVVAAWRIAPLVITEAGVKRVENIAPKFEIHEFLPLATSLITTGMEIFRGERKDFFAAKLEAKLARYGAQLLSQTIAPDDASTIAAAIIKCCDAGVRVVICTGGMSVDADDRTPAAIKLVCDEIIFKGVPALPGSNLMLGKRGDAYVFGVPACAVHADITALDIVMNRVYSGLAPTRDDVRSWGVGGLCRACELCNFPVCRFGSR